METKSIKPEDYIFLLKSIVSKFIKNQKIEDSEIYSHGCIALMNATKSYDSSKGSFSTWATKVINSSIIDYYRKSKKYNKFENLGDDSSLISDNSKAKIPDIVLSILLKENKKEAKIDRQNKQILLDYYLNNKSWAEIGRKLKLSRERVRQRGQKALVDIRNNNKIILEELECSYF